MSNGKTMTLPFLTNLHVGGVGLGVTVGGFIMGDAIGGINGGLAGAIAGGIVGLIGAILTALLTLRKQNTDGAIAIDRERDAILERTNNLHQAEVQFLRTQASQEKEFLQRQVVYHENLELVTRKRLHAMVGEVQRCVIYIRLCDEAKRTNQAPPAEFTLKTFEDIVSMYPLPEHPQNR